MFQNHLRTALRHISRNGSMSVLNLIGLSVGMAAAVLIFLWVDNELTFDNYHPGADRIYRLTENGTSSATPMPLAKTLRTDLPSAEAVTLLQPAFQTNMYLGNEPVAEKTGAYVDSAWFRVFHYDFIAGSPAAFNKNLFSLVLSQSKAQKYFGNQDAVGRTIRIDTVPYVVAGVVRDQPANTSFQPDILMPLGALLTDSNERKFSMNWGNYTCYTFVKLRPGVYPVAAGHLISSILKMNNPRVSDNDISLLPLKELHFETGETSGGLKPTISRKTVYIFTIVGILLLVIACVNYVNLTTARASLRAKEVGIRKLVGAGKGSLFGQFLLESAVISLAALVLTVGLVLLAMPLFRQLTGADIHAPLSTIHSWMIIGGTLAAAAIMNGIYPALLLSSFQPLRAPKGTAIMTFKDVSLRKGLVVLQFTVSIILIAGTLVIQRQLYFIQHTNPGYDRSQVFVFRFPWAVINQRIPDQTKDQLENQTAARAEGIKRQLLAYPAIADVSLASQSIADLYSSNAGSANWDGKDPNYTPQVFQLGADESFRATTHVEMAQGRWFDPSQPTDRHNFILNETAVREFNIHRPVVGQRFIFQQDTGRIIGVVKDFHYATMHKQIGPLVIADRPSWRAMVYIKTRPGKTAEALAGAHAVWSKYVPGQPFDYTFLDETFDGLYKADARAASLVLIFSVIAVIISCLGLLGLAAFTAQQRTKEIGIRKVMGATVGNIVALLSEDFVKLVMVAVVMATPVAWWAMHGWINDFAYHVPLTPWVFVGAGLLATGIAAVTVGVQAIRAAGRNVVLSLREE